MQWNSHCKKTYIHEAVHCFSKAPTVVHRIIGAQVMRWLWAIHASGRWNSISCCASHHKGIQFTHSLCCQLNLSAKFMLQQIEVKSSWVMQQRDSKVIPANALPVSKIRHVCWTDSRLVCLSPAPTHASVALSTHYQECCAHWAQNGNSHAISKSKEGFL